MESRSFFIGIRQFPICARCTGILFSSVLFIPLVVLAMILRPPFFIPLLLLIPMIVDGFTQLLTRYESTNIRRFITGLLFGGGAQLTMILLLVRLH